MEENGCGNTALAIRNEGGNLASLGIQGPLSQGSWQDFRNHFLDRGVPEDQLPQGYALIMAMRAPALGSPMAVALTADKPADGERLLAACAAVQPEGGIIQPQGLTSVKAFTLGPQLSGKCLVGDDLKVLGKAAPQVLKLFQSGAAWSQVAVEKGEGRLDTRRFEGTVGLVVMMGSPEEAEKYLPQAVRIHLPASPKNLADKALLRAVEASGNGSGSIRARMIAVMLEKVVPFCVRVPNLDTLLDAFPEDIPNRQEKFSFLKEILSLVTRMNATPELCEGDLMGKGLGLPISARAKEEVLSSVNPRLHSGSELVCAPKDYAVAKAVLDPIFRNSAEINERERFVFETLKKECMRGNKVIGGPRGKAQTLEAIACRLEDMPTFLTFHGLVVDACSKQNLPPISESTLRRVLKGLENKGLVKERKMSKSVRHVYTIETLDLDGGTDLPKPLQLNWPDVDEIHGTFWNPVTGMEEPL